MGTPKEIGCERTFRTAPISLGPPSSSVETRPGSTESDVSSGGGSLVPAESLSHGWALISHAGGRVSAAGIPLVGWPDSAAVIMFWSVSPP